MDSRDLADVLDQIAGRFPRPGDQKAVRIFLAHALTGASYGALGIYLHLDPHSVWKYRQRGEKLVRAAAQAGGRLDPDWLLALLRSYRNELEW